MSANGSIATVRSPALRWNAPGPYHSRRPLLLCCRSPPELYRARIESGGTGRGADRHAVPPRAIGVGPRGRWLDIVILATPQQRGAGRNQAGENREQERLMQPGADLRGGKVREER